MVVGTVTVMVMDLLGAGKAEVALSSEEVRASRQGPCVLQRTRLYPKQRGEGNAKNL